MPTDPLSDKKKLRAIRRAIWDYHHALDTRQHGGVAADGMVKQVQFIMGKPWVQGKTLKQKRP